ncbi:CLUMA_CG012293, isoform A [Clunio marinus]|uniref:CLUMA_CG012293, isoform A n=1 Tax=Clunio marinus TaxID=568069 RepID=A0A1J1IFQ7_9DIPT|nr:CLUMA_CG012293, isoform A [Clunio marinus]
MKVSNRDENFNNSKAVDEVLTVDVTLIKSSCTAESFHLISSSIPLIFESQLINFANCNDLSLCFKRSAKTLQTPQGNPIIH